MIKTNDWYGRPSPYRPRVEIRLGETDLVFAFAAEKAPHCDNSLAEGEFKEGLWEKDVAEFFVSADGRSYQEINISPTGAYWSALFSDYRVREKELHLNPTIEANIGPDSWSVVFKVECEKLVPWLDVPREKWRFTPTAILHDPHPAFFCWAEPQSMEPDFHAEHLRRPLSDFLD